jgi:anaphase-promoting complex subunit 3
MTPKSINTSSSIGTLINHYISIFLYENAKFLAERLYYESPTSVHLNLLAKCYYSQGKIQQVYHLLKDDNTLINRYMFAQACIQLKKYNEAEGALTSTRHIHPDNLTDNQISQIPGGASGLYLLGIICKKEQRKEFAIAYFRRALQVHHIILFIYYA